MAGIAGAPTPTSTRCRDGPGRGAGQRAYVGVIDQGIDISHPDLGVEPGGAIWTNPFDPVDGVDNDGNGYVDDVHGWDFSDQTNTVYDGDPASSTSTRTAPTSPAPSARPATTASASPASTATS